MSGSHREIEIKLPFRNAPEARERLATLGARLVRDRTFEDNVLFERAADPLKPQRKALRLRRVGLRAVLTFKGPVAGEHRHKVRTEHETQVLDAAATERILAGLGFAPAWRYQKYRTEFELEGLHACVDETPLGCFVELEGEPGAIDRVADLLGFSSGEYIRESYRTLHETRAAEGKRTAGDLLFEEGAPRR